MNSIRTMARKVSMNKRMFGTCKQPPHENNYAAKIMVGGVCAIPVLLMVKYEVDLSTYEENMVYYRACFKEQSIDIQHGPVTLLHIPQKPTHPFW